MPRGQRAVHRTGSLPALRGTLLRHMADKSLSNCVICRTRLHFGAPRKHGRPAQTLQQAIRLIFNWVLKPDSCDQDLTRFIWFKRQIFTVDLI